MVPRLPSSWPQWRRFRNANDAGIKGASVTWLINALLTDCLLGCPESASTTFAATACAANVKLFFRSAIAKTALPNTLQTAGADDRALPGGNQSTDSGARPAGGQCRPPPKFINWDGMNAKNPRGLGTESPERLPPLQSTHFVSSALC